MDDNISEAVKELVKLAGPIELLRIAPMPEVERLSSCSDDHIRKHHADKLVDLGGRRKGMRIIDALLIRRSRDGPSRT